MKQTDKFLVGIVAAIVVVVVAAFALALMQPQPTYVAGDTPEATAYNYLFALQQKDYIRAYGYLSSKLKAQPDSPEAMAADLARERSVFEPDVGSAAWEAGSAQNSGGLAVVTIRELRSATGGIFSGGQYRRTFEMRLQQEAGAWKIVGSDSYWASCWDKTAGCD